MLSDINMNDECRAVKQIADYSAYSNIKMEDEIVAYGVLETESVTFCD